MTNVMEMFNLKGKTAVVTGGSGLYGRQIVEALAEAGATVYTVSRNLESNESYAKTMRQRGYQVFAGQLDQGDEESIKKCLADITNDGKKVDILINNSVLRTMKTGTHDRFHDSAENFAKSMHVNATGLFMISRAFGDHMAENGGGSIVNIGSYMGSVGPNDILYRDTPMDGFTPDYFFHKGGMVNFTRFLASYYGPKGVRCNVLNPGGFFDGSQHELFIERYNDCTFLKRMANESDLKGAIVFLASAASSYITGAVIPVDGGYTAK